MCMLILCSRIVLYSWLALDTFDANFCPKPKSCVASRTCSIQVWKQCGVQLHVSERKLGIIRCLALPGEPLLKFVCLLMMTSHAEVFLERAAMMAASSTSSSLCHRLAAVRRQTMLVESRLMLLPSVSPACGA